MSDPDTGLDRGTTALALRSPAALNQAPTFFPSGHSEGWKVATIVFGAPSAAALVGGLLGAALGMGVASVLLATVAAPFGMWGANHLWSERGKRRLVTAKSLYLTAPAAGLAELQRIVASAALPEVRLEAAATIALNEVARGDIGAAIETLSIREQDVDRPRRRRSWEAGLRAEILRSILAWLSPGSFTESGVTAADAFPDDGADEEGTALLAALRLLERAARDEDGPLSAAWHNVEASSLKLLLPTLHIITHALAAERLHHLLDDLHERLREDRSGLYRGMLRRLFPRMQILVEGGYRVSPPEVLAASNTKGLAVVAPGALVEIARPTAAELLPVGRVGAAMSFLGAYGVTGVATMLLIIVAGGPALLGVIGGIMLALYVGTPIAAILGSAATQRAERSRRVAPLTRLVPPPSEAWLTECASGPPGPVTRTSGYRRLPDLPLSQSVLFVAAHQAEQAIERGDLDEAWTAVEWWFSGFSGKLADTDPLYAVGSSLVRVAALTRHAAEARRLLAVLAEVGNEWDGPANRTIRGNAPAAVNLARVVVAGLAGEWDVVGEAMRRAREAPRVFMAEHDRALLAEIVRRGAAAGVRLYWDGQVLSVAMKPWLEAVLPPSDVDVS